MPFLFYCQNSADTGWASLASQVLPPLPAYVTSAATSTPWPQSPSSPRLSPPMNNATTGNGPPKLWPPASPCRPHLLFQPSCTRPPALCLLFNSCEPLSINPPPLPSSIFSPDTEVHHCTNIPNFLASFLFHAPAQPAPTSE